MQEDSHKKLIRQYLLEGNSITAVQAFNMFGCCRLASRISDLRNDGMDIEREMVSGISSHTGKTVRYAKYFIKKDKK